MLSIYKHFKPKYIGAISVVHIPSKHHLSFQQNHKTRSFNLVSCVRENQVWFTVARILITVLYIILYYRANDREYCNSCVGVYVLVAFINLSSDIDSTYRNYPKSESYSYHNFQSINTFSSLLPGTTAKIRVQRKDFFDK